ncbi:hypothetical protein GVAV_000059 [Gurleya vavrai]
MCIFFFIIDFCRTVVYETTRNNFTSKLVGPIQEKILDFEYIMQNINNPKINSKFWKYSNARKIEFLREHFYNQSVYSDLDIFNIFLGSKKDEKEVQKSTKLNEEENEIIMDENEDKIENKQEKKEENNNLGIEQDNDEENYQLENDEQLNDEDNENKVNEEKNTNLEKEQNNFEENVQGVNKKLKKSNNKYEKNYNRDCEQDNIEENTNFKNYEEEEKNKKSNNVQNKNNIYTKSNKQKNDFNDDEKNENFNKQKEFLKNFEDFKNLKNKDNIDSNNNIDDITAGAKLNENENFENYKRKSSVEFHTQEDDVIENKQNKNDYEFSNEKNDYLDNQDSDNQDSLDEETFKKIKTLNTEISSVKNELNDSETDLTNGYGNLGNEEILYLQFLADQKCMQEGVITKMTIKQNYKEKTYQNLIFGILTFYSDNQLNWINFLTNFSQIKKERENLYHSVSDCDRLFRYYNILLTFLEILVLITLMVITLETKLAVVSLTVSIFIFTFFPSLKKILESFLFIINNHPFDCGDRIYWKGENLIVKKITVFYTQCTKWDGGHVIISNIVLAKSSIYNAKRSKGQKLEVVFVINRKFMQKLQIVEDSFHSRCQSRKYKIQAFVFHIEEIQDSSYIKYKLIVTHENNFQNGFYMWKVHNNYVIILKELLNEHKINFCMLDIQASVQNEKLLKNQT